ncbi:MAG: hypothetical protein HY319_25340 [Armatimonadetes bacterium]|nr:hypothetical protein [Armatimonadota bacterium]
MRRPDRAIALVLVMLVMALMLLLMGAFVRVHHGSLSILQSGSDREAMERACASAMDYCVFRLEHNKNWGKAKFGETWTDRSLAPALEATEIGNRRRIEGRIPELGATFQVDISNNLMDSTQSDEGVPAYGCRLDIRASVAGKTRGHEVILLVAPLFDGAAVSSGGIFVDAASLLIASEDPRRNQIRSRGEIRVPAGGKLLFEPKLEGPDKGLIWSQKDILVGGRSVSDPPVMNRVAGLTGGRFIPGALNNYDIHDLKISEIKPPSRNGTMKSGIYLFAREEVEVGGEKVTIRMLQRRTRALDESGFQGGTIEEFYYMAGEAPPGARLAGTSIEGRALDPAEPWLVDGLVKVDFDDWEVWVDEDANIQVDGDFGVASYQNTIVPRLRFGELRGGVSNQEENVGSSSITVTGDIGIEGPIVGTGKLLAEKSVHLRPNYAMVEADVESDLSIYAGTNIDIRPPFNDEAGQTADRDLVFRGLLYAAEDLSITTRPNQLLRIEGAAVARNGKINIYDASDVVLRYSPLYVDTLVKELPDGRIHLERALWKD